MRLKNRKTGEIKAFDEVMREAYKWNNYNSLAELNADWEDAPEEPKEYWYIGDSGEVWSFSDYYLGTEIEETHRGIGNLFESREEAEKAVEKLKAWKRLKDNGIIFILDEGNVLPSISIHSKEDNGPALKSMQIVEDLTLLFGGEE